MRTFYLLLTTILLLCSCSKDHQEQNSPANKTARRTVIVYMAAENDLSTIAKLNLDDMCADSLAVGSDNHLVAYVDMAMAKEYFPVSLNKMRLSPLLEKRSFSIPIKSITDSL